MLPMRYPAGRKYRLTRRGEIERLFEKGLRASDATMTLFGWPNELGHCRAAYGVSKRHGNAVRRNRVRRLCREAFRLSREQLPAGWDFFLILRPGASNRLETLMDSLKGLAARLDRSFAARGDLERP